jgi:hypothetical protein
MVGHGPTYLLLMVNMGIQELPTLDKYIREWLVTMESSRHGTSPHWWVLNTHLLCHVVDQLRDLGPVREYWMFVFESLNGKIDRWVKNNAYPVQSIMNGIGRQKTIQYVRGLLMALRNEVPRPLVVPALVRDRVVVAEKGKKHTLTADERACIDVWMRTNVGHYRRLQDLLDAYHEEVRAR